MLRTVRGVSIERRLPLLMSLLLLVVIAALAGSAYFEVRRLAIAAARVRLEAVTTQLASSNADSYRRRVVALRAIAGNDTLRQYFARRAPADRAIVERLIAPLLADTPAGIGVTLREAGGERVLALGDTTLLARLPLAALGDTAAIGDLATVDTTIAFPTIAPVRDGRRTIGHLVQWRRINTSARARAAIADFIGNDADVWFGNRSGSVWVDLGGTHGTPPPIDLDTGGFAEFDRPGKGTQLAVVRPMAGTPWLMEVDFPRPAVLSGLRTFLRRLGVVAAAVLILGTLSGWIASRHITRPLQRVTEAAECVAQGDFSKPLADDAQDEIGRLARAFNKMAAQVHATQQGLEEKVATRTGELKTAMKALEDAQDELVRKERLALLGQLSSSVGHELRNPLGVMSNAVYYLQAVLPDAPETAKEYLGILRDQIAVSEKIVSDLLDFARVRKPERRVVTLNDILAEQLQGQGVPANVRVATQISPDTPAVFADPVHLAQIVRNLASNAYQAMEKTGGTLTVRAMHDGPGNVQIEVADTGGGIAPEVIDKVFEPLFTTKARGIGLGLPVSRTLAIANGGALSVRSTPGQGAVFTLILPAPTGGAS
jgi:signal transduction histidine kinase